MKYWKRTNSQGITTTVESYSHSLDVNGATEISETEFQEFLEALPKLTPLPVRDLINEIDTLKERVSRLETS